MSATATISFRVKPEIKRRADALFARLGLTTSAAMNVLLMQTLEHRGFAAPVALPTGETRTDEEEADETPNPSFHIRPHFQLFSRGRQWSFLGNSHIRPPENRQNGV